MGEKTQAASKEYQWNIKNWFSDLDKDVHKKLEIYMDELVKFNSHINLVSHKTLKFADVIHFSDSILASRIIAGHLDKNEIYDFGSGNGFPGAVFALLYPNINVNLVDSDARKCEFLKHIKHELDLKNVQVLNSQMEQLPDGSVHQAMSRGFAGLTNALLKSRKVVSKGGVFYHIKGDEWAQELSMIPGQVCSYWMPELLKEYDLPAGGVRFAVVRTIKTQ